MELDGAPVDVRLLSATAVVQAGMRSRNWSSRRAERNGGRAVGALDGRSAERRRVV
jgi:hypothetical protein